MKSLAISAPDTTATTSILGNRLPDLAMELACKLESTQDVIARYGISAAEMKQLAAEPEFKKLYKEAKIAWGSVENAKERNALKASMAAEASLLRIYQLIHNENTPPSSVIDAHKHLSNLGNLMPSRSGETDHAAKHSIIINIGKSQGKEPIKVEGRVIEQDET